MSISSCTLLTQFQNVYLVFLSNSAKMNPGPRRNTLAHLLWVHHTDIKKHYNHFMVILGPEWWNLGNFCLFEIQVEYVRIICQPFDALY